ncbi:MAG: LLM class flavin-dependent oxidoreductase [Bacteroidota bacterium]|jgi:luciferase family oxidoreductase group 1
MENFKIGLLEFGLRDASMNSLQIINDVIEYAQKADELGFSRFWLAEHHYPSKRRAWNSPTPLVPILAASTHKIKIGTAGVLLGIHNPYHVAANYKLLANLFPRRIDLGIANGVVQGAVCQRTVGLSSFSEVRKTFEGRSRELVEILRNEDELFNPEDGISLPPFRGKLPEIWTLSTSAKGIYRAIDLEANFCRSIFHEGADMTFDKEIIAEYREVFENRYGYKPTFSVSVHGFCSTDSDLIRTMRANYEEKPKGWLIGEPSAFYEQAMILAQNYGGIDELIIMDIGEKPAHRVESMELIAEIFTTEYAVS